MGFRRKYKFSIIDHLYYTGSIRRIHNRWFMPLEAIFFLCIQCFPFASYNEIPIFGNTVVAVVSFVCRLGLGNSRGVFKD